MYPRPPRLSRAKGWLLCLCDYHSFGIMSRRCLADASDYLIFHLTPWPSDVSAGGICLMRIALVNPVSRRSEGYHTANGAVPQLGLQVLARLTPDEHHVDIIDEALGASRTEELLRAGNYDLVGLTAYTSSATRAYEIAGLCRQQGIATIMGGAHATAVPDEPGAYVDSVAVGECDVIWQQILADAQAGRLAKRYDGSLADLSAGHGAGKQGLHPINGHYEIGRASCRERV